jgi:hypothetical protein
MPITPVECLHRIKVIKVMLVVAPQFILLRTIPTYLVQLPAFSKKQEFGFIDQGDIALCRHSP